MTAPRLVRRRNVLAAGLAIASSLPFGIAHATQPAGTWTLTGSLNYPRYRHTATLLLNGKVLIAGGSNPAVSELYDPATGSWSVSGTLNASRVGHTATLLPGGQVLVAGGSNGTILASAELYDPSTGAWQLTGSMAAGRAYHTATLLPDGKVLIAGGEANPSGTADQALASAEVYDPSTGTWTAVGSLNGARYSHTATLLPSGTVLAAGGAAIDSTGTVAALASSEIYNASSGTWTVTGALSSARYAHTATLLAKGTILVAGGWASGLAVGPDELYDPAAGIWSDAGSAAEGAFDHAAVFLPKGHGSVLAAGGFVLAGQGIGPPQPTPSNLAQLYDPPTETWYSVGPMNAFRVQPTATLLPNGQVLVAGGVGRDATVSSGALPSAELYTQK